MNRLAPFYLGGCFVFHAPYSAQQRAPWVKALDLAREAADNMHLASRLDRAQASMRELIALLHGEAKKAGAHDAW